MPRKSTLLFYTICFWHLCFDSISLNPIFKVSLTCVALIIVYMHLTFSEQFSSQYCHSPSPQTDQFHSRDMKSVEQIISYPSDAMITARCFFKPNIGQSTGLMEKKSATMESGTPGSHPVLRTSPVSSCCISYPRPLPPVPHLPK